MANDHGSTSGGEKFRTAYCAHFKCRDEVFEEKIFWRCLPPHARPLAFLLELTTPSFFVGEFEVMRNAGEATDLEDIVAEANKLHDTQHLRVGFLRGALKVRVSGRRLVNVGNLIWGKTRRRN
jgi:hypothetical protein